MIARGLAQYRIYRALATERSRNSARNCTDFLTRVRARRALFGSLCSVTQFMSVARE